MKHRPHGRYGSRRPTRLRPVLRERSLPPLRPRPLAVDPPPRRRGGRWSSCWSALARSSSPSAPATATSRAAAPPRARRRPRASSSSRCPPPRTPTISASRRSRPRTPPGSPARTRSPTRPRVALAVYPSTGDVPRARRGHPGRRRRLAGRDRGSALAGAAGRRAAPGHRAAARSRSSPRTRSAALDPGGSAATAGRQAVRDRRRRRARRTTRRSRSTAATRRRSRPRSTSCASRLAGEPDAHRGRELRRGSAIAMPGRRLGGPLRRPGPVRRQATRSPRRRSKALRSHDGAPVFVLGPESAIGPAGDEGDRARRAGSRAGRRGRARSRTRSPSPATSSGSFGWNINDPGHGFVIANTDRPLDAAVAAPLSASGTWGPLLVTDDARGAARRAARLPARPQARLRGRPDPRRLQPRLADRRHDGDLGRPAGARSTSSPRWPR